MAIKLQDDPDPFAKVKQLVQELVERLEAEAAEEADHKSWCDSELTANEATRTTKSEEVEMLHGTVDKLTSDIAVLKKEIGETSTAIAEITKNVAKTTELRNKEKAENEATIQDAKDGQTAMTEVIDILQDFYQKAGEATALVQVRKHSKAPPIFDAPFTGGSNQDSSSGVVGMLQVIQSDFARLESDTATAEDTASTDYDNFMDASSADKAAKEKEVADKKNEQTTKEGDLLAAQTDLENVEKELDAAMKYFDKLKPSCLDSGVSYEERVQRREEEIQSLKEALTILSADAAPGSVGPLRSATSGVAYD
jgi:chromosome segregation ATPase